MMSLMAGYKWYSVMHEIKAGPKYAEEVFWKGTSKRIEDSS